MPRGRPSKNGKELQFKTVAVPEETYRMISELAEIEKISRIQPRGDNSYVSLSKKNKFNNRIIHWQK